jgi:hypothetical protein
MEIPLDHGVLRGERKDGKIEIWWLPLKRRRREGGRPEETLIVACSYTPLFRAYSLDSFLYDLDGGTAIVAAIRASVKALDPPRTVAGYVMGVIRCLMAPDDALYVNVDLWTGPDLLRSGQEVNSPALKVGAQWLLELKADAYATLLGSWESVAVKLKATIKAPQIDDPTSTDPCDVLCARIVSDSVASEVFAVMTRLRRFFPTVEVHQDVLRDIVTHGYYGVFNLRENETDTTMVCDATKKVDMRPTTARFVNHT